MDARQGLNATSQTRFDQHAALAALLKPTWQRLCSVILEEPVLIRD